MKKYVFLLIFAIGTIAAHAQTFNPYEFFTSNQTLVSGSLGKNFKEMLATKYNNTISVHHGVDFNFFNIDKTIKLVDLYQTIKIKYQNNAFSVEDGMSLIYFLMRDGRIGNHILHHKRNHFVISDDGNLYVVDVSWSDIQNKWIMLAFDKGNEKLITKFPLITNSITIQDAEIICAK